MLTNSYLITTKNLEGTLNTITTAKAPERFTIKFLSDLGFSSSNDRLIIGVLKSVGLIDDTSAPTQRYFEFLDQSQSKTVLAIGIKEAYEDLFNLRIDAQNMTYEEVKNKLKTLTQGQKSEKVIALMANTFRALCDYAEWENLKPKNTSLPKKDTNLNIPVNDEVSNKLNQTINEDFNEKKVQNLDLNYNIQIHLPETRDMAVYDAIFQSLKKHLI